VIRHNKGTERQYRQIGSTSRLAVHSGSVLAGPISAAEIRVCPVNQSANSSEPAEHNSLWRLVHPVCIRPWQCSYREARQQAGWARIVSLCAKPSETGKRAGRSSAAAISCGQSRGSKTCGSLLHAAAVWSLWHGIMTSLQLSLLVVCSETHAALMLAIGVQLEAFGEALLRPLPPTVQADLRARQQEVSSLFIRVFQTLQRLLHGGSAAPPAIDAS